MVGFKLTAIEDNTEGWGPPPSATLPTDMPFLPFSKGERLGRIAEFGASAGRGHHHYHQSRYREPAPGTSIFNFERGEEDDAFEMVDNKPNVKKPSGGGGGGGQRHPRGPTHHHQGAQGMRQQRPRGAHHQHQHQHHQHYGGGQAGGRGQQQWRDQQARAQYTASVDIRPNWTVLGDQIALMALNKLATNPGEYEELAAVGSLVPYDRAADRVGPKNPAKLRRAGVRAKTVSMAADPIIQRLASQGAGDVFMSDTLLTVLMTAPRSVYPWDILIVKKAGILFFDCRPGSTLEYLTNGETAPDAIHEDRDSINGVQQLCAEATGVNQAFREQVLQGSGGSGGQKAMPLSEDETLPAELAASGSPPPGFRYRRWTLGDLNLVVRCEIDACLSLPHGGLQTLAIHALNEFDPKWSGVDWRQKLENQRGAVLATELKNNAAKMARWTAAALVGGVDMIKLGYVSRASFKDPTSHVLLGTQAVKPRDFAAQMNLNMDNAWGIVRALLGLCVNKMESDGKFFRFFIATSNIMYTKAPQPPPCSSILPCARRQGGANNDFETIRSTVDDVVPFFHVTDSDDCPRTYSLFSFSFFCASLFPLSPPPVLAPPPKPNQIKKTNPYSFDVYIQASTCWFVTRTRLSSDCTQFPPKRQRFWKKTMVDMMRRWRTMITRMNDKLNNTFCVS